MPSPSKKLTPAKFVNEVVKDPKSPVETLLLRGYVGNSSEDRHTRLYFDPQLSSYVEIPDDAILHSLEIPAAQSPLGDTYVWIKRDAQVIHSQPAPARQKGTFLEGPVLAGHNLPPTLPAICNHTQIVCPPPTPPVVCHHTPIGCPPPTLPVVCHHTPVGCPPPTLPVVCHHTPVGCPPPTLHCTGLPQCHFTQTCPTFDCAVPGQPAMLGFPALTAVGCFPQPVTINPVVCPVSLAHICGGFTHNVHCPIHPTPNHINCPIQSPFCPIHSAFCPMNTQFCPVTFAQCPSAVDACPTVFVCGGFNTVGACGPGGFPGGIHQ